MREKLGGTFEIALVLLGVFSAAETPYFAQVWNDAVALRFATVPFFLIIPLWMIKELYQKVFEKENKREVWLLLTELCWELWAIALSYYLLFFWLYQLPSFPQFGGIYSLMLALVMFGIALGAHYYAYRNEAIYYYNLSSKWSIIRCIVFLAGAALMVLAFTVIYNQATDPQKIIEIAFKI